MNTVPVAPGPELLARELNAAFGDEEFWCRAGFGDGSVKEAADLRRTRLCPEDGEIQDPPRIVVEHGHHPPAVRPQIR